MKKIYGILLFAAALMGLSSCNLEDSEGFYIGKSTSYPSFCGVDYEWSKDRLPEQTLEMELGDLKFTSPIVLQVVYKKDKDKDFKPAGKLLTITGDNVVNDLITISPKEASKNIKFRFNKHGVQGVKSARYTIALRVENPGDLDQINGQQAKRGLILDSDLMWIVNYEEVMNPLLKAIIWIGCIFFACVFIWFVILRRMFFPTFRISTLVLNYTEGGQVKGMSMVNLRNARMVVCAKAPKYQSSFMELLCGRIAYETNEFWERTVEMKPLGAEGVGVMEVSNPEEPLLFRIPPKTITEFNTPKSPYEIKRAKSDKAVKISIG